MQRKVFRTGNSIVVSLPKDALDFLGITEGSEVRVELDKERQRLVIAPAQPGLSVIGEDFARQVESEHLDIVDAIRRKDSSAARLAAQIHMDQARIRIRKAGRLLYRYFPDALIDFQVINPQSVQI